MFHIIMLKMYFKKNVAIIRQHRTVNKTLFVGTVSLTRIYSNIFGRVVPYANIIRKRRRILELNTFFLFFWHMYLLIVHWPLWFVC